MAAEWQDLSEAAEGRGLDKIASQVTFNLEVLTFSREDPESRGIWRRK